MKNIQAFPFHCANNDCNCDLESGMTLRDYFAAAALQGMMASPTGAFAGMASEAYIYADRMLAEREKAK